MLRWNVGRNVAAITLTLISINATAGEDTGTRKIVDIGCHNDIATCYVSLDGPAFGSTLGCVRQATNEFRFDNGDTAIGKRSYSTLLAAYLSGKNVSIYLDGCTAQGAPKLVWFHVFN